jgi:hypothetical protein
MTIQETRRALGAILNLSRYKPAATLEQANTRLYLVDQIALKALQDLKNIRFFESKGFQAPRSGLGIQRGIERPSRPAMVGSQTKVDVRS